MRNVVTLVITALCTCGLVAYARGAEQQQLTVDERIKRIDDFMRDRPSFLQKQSLQEFRGLAKLQGEKMEKVPNRHVAGEMLEYRQLRFNGLELYGHVTSPQEFSPIVVTVTTPSWKIARGLDVGTPAGRIGSTSWSADGEDGHASRIPRHERHREVSRWERRDQTN